MNYQTIFLCFLLGLSIVSPVQAAVFDPGFVLADRELDRTDSMTQEDIQSFLREKGGALVSFFSQDLDGITKNAATILSRVATQFTLSPRFLLVMLQKEQSLITDPSPKQSQLDWATGYAVCDGCHTGDTTVSRFRGFAKQVDSMAQQFRLGYLSDLAVRGKTSTNMAPGQQVVIDGLPITPQNNATAALYTYTPHLEGNRNFWRIWQEWFGAPDYPSGTVLRDRVTGLYWRLRDGKKQFVPSRAVLDSYGAPAAIDVEPGILQEYDAIKPLAFPNYSLVKTEMGEVYLLVDDQKRHFASLDDLRALGFAPDEVLQTTTQDLSAYTIGPELTAATAYPHGTIFQNQTTQTYYFVDAGKRHILLTKDLLNVRYRGWKITRVPTKTLEEMFEGSPVTYPDGALLRLQTDSTVYVIANGHRRPIADENTFKALGYAWSSVKTVPRDLLEIHQPGDLVRLL